MKSCNLDSRLCKMGERDEREYVFHQKRMILILIQWMFLAKRWNSWPDTECQKDQNNSYLMVLDNASHMENFRFFLVDICSISNLTKGFIIKSSSSSSSSSCRAASTDILDHLSPLFPIVHRLRQVFWVTSCVPHIAAVCKFGLVVLLLLGHMWGSIVVRHLRARLCFSSSVRRVWLVWPV